jgi:heparosan-N-sulfate-glucuronate 5-epimerase
MTILPYLKKEFIQLNMEESKTISLHLGDVSWNPKLGIYYIDMRPAKIHYTSNIWGGSFDDNGVPMISTDIGIQYSPINIAQFGFILHAEYLENPLEQIYRQLENCVRKILELKVQFNDNCCTWYHNYEEVKYHIPSPWASAMAQGEIISLLLRFNEISPSENLLHTAKEAYNFMLIEVENGGVKRLLVNKYFWFEEYPSSPPSNVLNGFIYAIFGIVDLIRVTNDPKIRETFEECIKTLEYSLKEFDSGYWSYYDLQKKELVRYYYQKNVHAPQLEILYILTGRKIFQIFKEKWQRNVNPINFIIVQIMYRLLPRWRKLKKILTNAI